MSENAPKEYRRIPLDKESVSEYKKLYSGLSHIRVDSDHVGELLITEDRTEVIGFLNCNIKNNSIQALEINNKFRRMGFGKLLLNRAVRVHKAKFLTVRKNNTAAIALYEAHHWKTFKQEGIMLFMEYSK